METTWISVKDRLPEINENVFVAKGSQVILLAFYLTDKGSWFPSSGFVYPEMGITHWQPLLPPKP